MMPVKLQIIKTIKAKKMHEPTGFPATPLLPLLPGEPLIPCVKESQKQLVKTLKYNNVQHTLVIKHAVTYDQIK